MRVTSAPAANRHTAGSSSLASAAAGFDRRKAGFLRRRTSWFAFSRPLHDVPRFTARKHRRIVRGGASLSGVRRPTITLQDVPDNLEAWGAWYEEQGDPTRASAAYRAAYADSPDTTVALSAGRTAERAGDTVTALSYYAHLLDIPLVPRQETALAPE